MKDPLMTFIEEHRDAFDTEAPKDALRERTAYLLRQEKIPKQVLKIPGWLKWAAAACLIVAISYQTIRMYSGNSDSETIAKETKEKQVMKPDPLLERIDPGSALEIQRMAREASQRESGLDLLKKDDPALYDRFLKDLAELDSIYQSLRVMLTQTPNHQQLIEAMEINLKMRIELLEKQNEVIQDIEINKKRKS